MPEFNVSRLSFQLTLHGGNVKDLAHDALTAAKDGKYEQAESLISDAEQELTKGHDIQAEVMRNDDREEPVYTNLLLSHALDHLMSAESQLKLIEEMIELHKKLEE